MRSYRAALKVSDHNRRQSFHLYSLVLLKKPSLSPSFQECFPCLSHKSIQIPHSDRIMLPLKSVDSVFDKVKLRIGINFLSLAGITRISSVKKSFSPVFFNMIVSSQFSNYGLTYITILLNICYILL